jgi:hypothetical protein
MTGRQLLSYERIDANIHAALVLCLERQGRAHQDGRADR